MQCPINWFQPQPQLLPAQLLQLAISFFVLSVEKNPAIPIFLLISLAALKAAKPFAALRSFASSTDVDGHLLKKVEGTPV